MGKQITTAYGVVEGVDCGTYTVFRGVPYAKPPVGELRWRAPESPAAFDGVYQADTFSAKCMQSMPGPSNPYTKEFYEDPEFLRPSDEDCLYLNIWMPADAGAGNCPVAFWIHGGGFGGGYSSEIEFDGQVFAEQGIILVTIGYRCGAFGFLAHPWLDAENERGISGNYGILDQIAALTWVRGNIAAFGGDPENITVFGQSAGCMSTQILLSSPLTEGMIAKAILQSGCACEVPDLDTQSLESMEKWGAKFVEVTGAASLEELRAIPQDKLLRCWEIYQAETFGKGMGLTFTPNVDGYVLKESVGSAWKNGTFHHVPTMVGCTGNDLLRTPEDAEKGVPGRLLDECKRWAARCDELGLPSYVYFFDRQLPGDDWGAFHTAEVWYTFATLGRCWRPMEEHDYALSRQMSGCWAGFFKESVPADPADWAPYTAADPFVKEFK